MSQLDPTIAYVILALVGVVAGFINTVAGGGSMLTVPALMLVGLPANVANATNRVGVLLQSGAATAAFERRGALDRRTALILAPLIVLGSFAGSQLAAVLPNAIFEPILIGTMITVALFLLLRRRSPTEADADSAAHDLKSRPVAVVGLLFAGFYGGFIQAGVGLVLLAVVAGTLNHSLGVANALKSAVVFALNIVALAVFASQGLVDWIPGFVLAIGAVAGSQLGVRLSLEGSQDTIRRIALVMAIVTCVVALLR